jgi:Fur family ferric uptake transcriptional regulator
MLQIYMSEKLLKDKNIRTTPFRLAVLDVFERHKNAIGLSTIEEKIGAHDRITLYRTLKTFIEQGIIHEITLPGGEKRMALCADDCEHDGHQHQHEHIHFQCKNCNEIFCVDVDDFPKIKLKHYKIDSLEITAKGLCKKCK